MCETSVTSLYNFNRRSTSIRMATRRIVFLTQAAILCHSINQLAKYALFCLETSVKALLMSSNYTYQPAEFVLAAILLIAAYVDIIGVNDALLK